MKDLHWFTTRVGSFVLRGTNEIYIKSYEMAEKLYAIQSENYTFSPKIQVHKRELTECESCSA